jgi:cytochrome P450
MPIYAIHRHARRWRDPDAFDPRASRRAGRGDPALPVHAVRGGPRICIGRSFALVEATAILATLVRHARFEVAGR